VDVLIIGAGAAGMMAAAGKRRSKVPLGDRSKNMLSKISGVKLWRTDVLRGENIDDCAKA
jgi:cation diffusion facilitator CzcD-associated flavoprotein CzcO